MFTNDKRNTRFTMADLPSKSAFEKNGVQMPVLARKFEIVQPAAPSQPEMTVRATARYTPAYRMDFQPRQFVVQIPAYKAPDPQIRPGMQGEAKRQFVPLVPHDPSQERNRSR